MYPTLAMTTLDTSHGRARNSVSVADEGAQSYTCFFHVFAMEQVLVEAPALMVVRYAVEKTAKTADQVLLSLRASYEVAGQARRRGTNERKKQRTLVNTTKLCRGTVLLPV